MRFATFVWKNVARRPLRSLLTVFAVAIAIGAVVSLVGVATGFERSFISLYEANGIDLLVVRSGLGQRLTSTLNESLRDRLRAIPGVKHAIPGLVDVITLEEAGLYGVVVQGWLTDPDLFAHLRMQQGRPLSPDDGKTLLLGSILAKNLGKQLHDTIELYENERFEVVGIFDSPHIYENGSMIVRLDQLQRLLDRPGQVTGYGIVVEASNGPKPTERVRKEIEALMPGLSAMTIREHAETMTELRAAAAAWLTSTLALLIGTAGVLNTMLMAVQERTQEIGILRAVGWDKRRVIRMVLAESLLLSLAGACLGTIGGIAIVRLLTQVPLTNGVIDGQISPQIVAEGFVIALVVGLAGGSVAAVRAARMLPTSALRHE